MLPDVFFLADLVVHTILFRTGNFYIAHFCKIKYEEFRE